MADKKYYCYCESNCKYETMTKEQILAAITQAVNEGTIGDINTGFVQTIKTINGHPLKFFVGAQSEYEALTDEEKEGVFALITNDTTKDALIEAIETLQSTSGAHEARIAELSGDVNGLLDGTKSAKKAVSATYAASAENATTADTATKANALSHTPHFVRYTGGTAVLLQYTLKDSALYLFQFYVDDADEYFTVMLRTSSDPSERAISNCAYDSANNCWYYVHGSVAAGFHVSKTRVDDSGGMWTTAVTSAGVTYFEIPLT